MNQFSNIAPDVVRQVMPRREALKLAGRGAAGVAIATLPIVGIANRALAATSQRAHGVLNFALTLEYLEESFYRQGLATSGLIPSADRAVYDQIQKHEVAHVGVLRGAVEDLGETPVTFSDTDFDFTADGTYPAFTDYATFMALAQGFEDTGVRAYKGQAGNLYTSEGRLNPLLTVALQIHSVEARHAAQIRRMRRAAGAGDDLQPWIDFEETFLPAGFEAIYAGEDNTVHAGVDVASISDVSTEEVTEAFDEPLTMEAVLAIADPFVIPDISGG